jgi:hypothetical protein
MLVFHDVISRWAGFMSSRRLTNSVCTGGAGQLVRFLGFGPMKPQMEGKIRGDIRVSRW